MEPHATIASWDAPDRLTIYDATQYVKGAQGIVAQAFGLPRDNVRVICPFVGGAFGAMDELAYVLKMDPLELRLVNNSPNHPIKGIRGQRSICVNATIRARGNLAGPDELTSHAQ